eukprot:TRINITY_DN24026_c0_g1_i1.p1 TRINITY_DN24026_c0_g1~~TRINITY_DN24026_c0_g1_i1.p1  ORF type:complete len:255 (+),score=66.42 TRINITY_DN24026_c0_g1_i1:90-767(+)
MGADGKDSAPMPPSAPPPGQQAVVGQPVYGQAYGQPSPDAQRGYAVQPGYGGPPPGQPQWSAHPQQFSNEWKYSLWSCFDNTALCCDACWCGVCHLARMYSAVQENRADDPNWPVCCGIVVCTWFIGGFAPCLMQWWLRDSMRNKYGIQGTACGDCCTVCWCGVCGIVQQHRELTDRGITPGVCCCGQPSGPAVQQMPYQPIPTQSPQMGHQGQGYGQAAYQGVK